MFEALSALTGTTRAGLSLFAGAAGAVAVLALYWAVKRSGRTEERAARANEALEIKDEQLKAAVNAPRGRDDIVDRLRHGGL